MYEPWNALDAPRFTGPRTYARLPYIKDLAGVDAAVFGMPWDGGDVVSLGRALRPRGGPLGLGNDPHLQRGPEGAGVRRAVDDRLRRHPDRARLHRGHARADQRVRHPAGAGRGGERRHRAATTRSRLASCARWPPSTARWASSISTPTPTCGTVQRPSLLARHDVPARALEEGIVEPGADAPGGHPRPALRRGRRGDPGDARRGDDPVDRAGRDDARPSLGRAGAQPGRRRPRVPLARRRLRRRGLLPGHGDPRGGRADELPGAVVTCAPSPGCRSSATTSSRWRPPTTGPAR